MIFIQKLENIYALVSALKKENLKLNKAVV